MSLHQTWIHECQDDHGSSGNIIVKTDTMIPFLVTGKNQHTEPKFLTLVIRINSRY